MQDIPFTQILVLLAFILFPLINWLLQQMQRRYQSQVPRQPPPQPAPRTFAKPPPIEIIVPSRERMPSAKLPELPLSRRNQSIKRSLFRSRRDLRRAIILMTVLGPCRANDSPDAKERSLKE
jgi:UDP:flavonoid glycosyltransferase YjiC (YdhE family)